MLDIAVNSLILGIPDLAHPSQSTIKMFSVQASLKEKKEKPVIVEKKIIKIVCEPHPCFCALLCFRGRELLMEQLRLPDRH